MKHKPTPCPHCAEPVPAVLLCNACWAEVPFNLRVERWTRMGRERAARDGATGYDHAAEVAALNRAEQAILGHLKQFSSAIA